MQVLAVVIVAAYSWIITTILLKILAGFGHLRVADDIQEGGVDEDMVGERAFNLWNMKNDINK